MPSRSQLHKYRSHPEQFVAVQPTTGSWSLVDADQTTVLNLTIISLPALDAPITGVEYDKAASGTWIPLTNFTGPKLYTLTGLTTGVAVSVRIRYVNAAGVSVPSAAKSATPTVP